MGESFTPRRFSFKQARSSRCELVFMKRILLNAHSDDMCRIFTKYVTIRFFDVPEKKIACRII